jgi:hypothetical protein
LAALLAWTPAAIGTAQYHQRQGRPSTQSLADRFVRDASRQGPVYVAAEVLSLSVPTERAAEAAIANARLSPDQQTRMRSRPTYNVDFIPMYTVQPEEAARYYDIRHFTAHDLVVVTDAVRGRYLADTARFAPEARFYRELDRYAVLDARYSPGQEARGAEIRVYRMSSEAAERIGRDRGVLTLPPLRPTDRIHPSDYMEFVEGMARAAYSHGEWARASQYYGAMLQGADAGWMTEPERLLLMRMVADLEVRSGATADAARHYETYLRSVPDDSTARAALDGLRARSARVSSPSTR